MLQRGGWSSSNTTNDVWLMSRRLARECALGPDWTGNGVSHSGCCSSPTSQKSPFIQASSVDFTEVSAHFLAPKSAGIILTVSSCGMFLMVANGCLIYVYELNRSHRPFDDNPVAVAGSLSPITSIICPKRVMACSMDTSSHRYAVAVLLDGRMGIGMCFGHIIAASAWPANPSNYQGIFVSPYFKKSIY